MSKIKLFVGLIFLLFFLGSLVIAQEEELKELELIIPTELNENEKFTITVISNGTAVENVMVIYNNSISERIYETDSSGEITVYTPEITSNNEMITLNIFAAKKGYFANETIINITNLPNLFFKGKRSQFEPNESILITILDNFGNPVENVKIEITDYTNVIMTYYTDTDGKVTIVAPDKDYIQGYYQIIASKDGYSIADKSIEVFTPHYDFSVFIVAVLFPLISFITIAFILILVVYPYMKKKNGDNDKSNEEGKQR
jgi:hypothetical protein